MQEVGHGQNASEQKKLKKVAANTKWNTENKNKGPWRVAKKVQEKHDKM